MKAKLANLAQTELDKYERSLKVYRDLKSVIETAFDEGKIEGKIEAAKQAKIKRLIVVSAIGAEGRSAFPFLRSISTPGIHRQADITL